MLDLEDAVAADQKDVARDSALAELERGGWGTASSQSGEPFWTPERLHASPDDSRSGSVVAGCTIDRGGYGHLTTRNRMCVTRGIQRTNRLHAKSGCRSLGGT